MTALATPPPEAPESRRPEVVAGPAAGAAVSGPSRWVTRLPLIVDAVAVALIVVATALMIPAWSSVFADAGFAIPMVAVAAIVAIAVAVVSRRRWSTPASFVTAVAVTLVVLAVVHLSDVADLPGNLVDGWKATASTGLLMATEPALVVPPIVVAALGAWVAAEAIVRRRLGAPAVAALAVAHAVVAIYTIGQWQPGWWFVAAITAVFGSLLAIGGLTRPGGASYADGVVTLSLRQVGSAAAVVGVLSLAAAGLTALVGDADQPYDLRESLARPLDISETATPLARVKAGLIDPENNSVFTVRVDGLGPDQTIPLIPVATLDQYDGTVWSTSARFEAAGSALPSPGLPNPTSGTVDVSFALTVQYPFRFLPQVGVLQEVIDGDLAWDPLSGSLATIDPEAVSYRGLVSPVADAELPEQLGDNDTSIDIASQRADLTEDQRAALNAYLAEVVDPDADPYDQLRAIQADLLSSRFGYNEQSPAGHSLAALTSYLQPDPTDDAAAARVGFSEHSAAAFAVLARELGVPSRVVVGYLLDSPLSADQPELVVSESMVHAWPEVWVDGTGWVRMDVTNKVNESPDQPDRTPAVSAAGVEANATDLPDVEEPVILPDEEFGEASSFPWWVLALPAIPVLYALLVIGGKALRRRRRRSGAPDQRVIGAWSETRDRFGELGLPSSSSLSALDVAEELDMIDLRDVGDPVVALAPSLDTALYSPAPATKSQASQAWEAASAAIREARKHASFGSKVKAALDPRALVRR